jgi:hypothetical protein
VQVESLVTFEFQTAIESSKTKAMLSDPEARQLAKHVVEPKFDTGSVAAGETIKVRISVNEQGEVIGVGNPYIVPGASFLAVMNALREWTFQSYLKEGKPVIFDADIAFQGR